MSRRSWLLHRRKSGVCMNRHVFAYSVAKPTFILQRADLWLVPQVPLPMLLKQ